MKVIYENFQLILFSYQTHLEYKSNFKIIPISKKIKIIF